MEIENKNTLTVAMRTGINLFVGAGFSILAKDKDEKKLPLGSDLLKELQSAVGPGPNNLEMYCTVKSKTHRQELNSYLTQRFKVCSFNDKYENINLLNLISVFTTNIDDLIPQVLARNEQRYINDQRRNGDSLDKKAINYLPLHGNVDSPEKGYTFSVSDIVNSFHDNGRSWQYLMHSIEKCPTIFVGYSMSDTATLQALTSSNTFDNAKKEMWILLRQPTEDEKDYYHALGFNIIVGDTKTFLLEIPNLVGEKKTSGSVSNRRTIEKLISASFIPRDNRNQLQRPIEDFYRGLPPIWSDILRNVIYRTSYFRQIQDSIYSPNRHTIVIGSPVSGKTTVAMQVGQAIQFSGFKFYFQDLSLSRAEYLSKLIGNEKALIVVDNFTDSIEAFLTFKVCPNVKLVGVDRTVNFGNVSHKFPSKQYDIINVTELSDADLQGVYDSLPKDIQRGDVLHKKHKKTDIESIYEFVVQNITKPSITSRYKTFIEQLDESESDLAEFLVLCAYMNRARVPLTMDVAYSYFCDLNYTEVLKIKKRLDDLLREDQSDNLVEDDIEGYRPRSYYIAEAILNYSTSGLLADVLWNFIRNVSKLQVCNYHTFKRWAFDKELMLMAFPKVADGEAFYKEAFLYDDHNPYVLQQGALYLSDKRQYSKAFEWIDRALTMTNNRHFSIRNSHAIILFDSNYEIATNDALAQLDKSMYILNQCFNDDQRRIFHALTYSKQAIKYYRRSPKSPTSIQYLNQAKIWLTSEQEDKPWHFEVKNLLKRVEEILRQSTEL